MVFVLKGSKEKLDRCKRAILLVDGDFGVTVDELSFYRKRWFQYQLEVRLKGPEENKERFLNRIAANYDILNGNILGLLEYL
jgi:hypothetical protein